MVANRIGALAVCDDKGDVIGVVSERDYLCKVGFLGRTSKATKVMNLTSFFFWGNNLLYDFSTMHKCNLCANFGAWNHCHQLKLSVLRTF